MSCKRICLLFLLILPLASVTIGTAYAVPPNPPTSLTGIPGNGQVTLSWTAPAGNPTDYKIEFRLSTDPSFSLFNDGVSTLTTVTVTGLTNGNLYVFRVIATNSDGDSSPSDLVALVPLENANPNFTFIPPPTLTQEMINAMLALGAPSNFVMPSANIIPSANFNPFDQSFNQKLEFTTAFNEALGGNPFTTYAIQTYSKPASWSTTTFWTVPPGVVPLSGGGEMALFKVAEIDANKPIFFTHEGIDPLPNGAKPEGVDFKLASGAAGVDIKSKLLSTPPTGAPAGADFYLDYTLTSTTPIDFGSASTFSSSPVISFTMGPVAGSVHPTNPTNSVNSAIICPDVELALVQSGVEVTTGITVTRDTAGDTSTACGYKGTVLHLSTYTGRARTSGGGGVGGSGGGGVVSTLELIRQRSCDPDGLGSGISLKLYKVSYDVASANKLWVDARSTCGPMILQVVSDGKISAGGITMEQPRLDEKIVRLEAPLTVDQKSFSIVLKDKRDFINRNFYISEPIYEKDYTKIEQWSSQINYTATLNSPNINATNTSNSDSTIPNWIKKNAAWWSDNSIGDDDFVQGIQFLVKNDIIHVPQTNEATSSATSQQIPAWIKNNAKWWADGLISDNDFVKGIQWLISNGIIRV